MTDLSKIRYMMEAFVKVAEAEYQGYEEALRVADSIKRVFELYSARAKKSAHDLLKQDYRAFHETKSGKEKYKHSLPFLLFVHDELGNPRRWLQTIQYAKLKVDTKNSNSSNVGTYINSNNTEFLRIDYHFPNQEISLHIIKTSKESETDTVLLSRAFPTTTRQIGNLVKALNDEILDWVTEHAPKGFLEQVVPNVEGASAQALSSPSPNNR